MPEVTHDSGAVGPLHAHLVVDMSRALAGPHAAMMLGDMGARGIEVEAPIGGDDDSRGWGPPFVGEAGTPEFVSTYFLSANRNKESVALDLKVESDRDTSWNSSPARTCWSKTSVQGSWTDLVWGCGRW